MKKIYFVVCLICMMADVKVNAQDKRKEDIVNAGIGFGMDFGGIGANIMYYPHRNVGLFFGGGYAIAGFGYNAGVKFRINSEIPHVAMPFLIAMYGYNAAIYVDGNTELNKMFYGPTFGVGVDLRSKKVSSAGYWSLSIMLPIRSYEVESYTNILRDYYGVPMSTLSPVGFSVGYKFILNN